MAASIVHKYMYISIIFNKYITIYIHIYIGYIQTFETYIIYLLLLLFFTKSYLTLCNPIDVSPQVPLSMGFFQVKILEWVAVSFFRGFFPPRNRTCISYIGRQILYH